VGLSLKDMNRFTLSFQVRQLQIRINSWLRLFTDAGEIIVQYVPCSERFSLDSNGCHQWTYEFCVQDTDLPSSIQDVCGITTNILVPPYLLAIPPINLEDTDTIDVQGDGSELNPYNFNVIIDPDLDNDLEARANGLFVEETGTPGPPGNDGTDGTDGADGADGTNGADGADGADGTDGADGAGPAVGSIFSVPSIAAPPNTEPLWGQLLTRIEYPELWAFIIASGNVIDDATWLGSATEQGHFSSGDGINTFRLPDMRGYFQRVWNGEVAEPDPSRGIGTIQDDGIEDHTHTLGNASDAGGGATPNVNSDGSVGGADDGLHTGSVFAEDQSTFEGIDETRPKNIAYMFVIQASSVV
jgi:hypothetical protein